MALDDVVNKAKDMYGRAKGLYNDYKNSEYDSAERSPSQGFPSPDNNPNTPPDMYANAQHTVEGTDLEGQLSAAANNAINNEGLGYGSGHYTSDQYDQLHDQMKESRGLMNAFDSFKAEKERTRPRTEQDTLDKSFLQNIGIHNLGNRDPNADSENVRAGLTLLHAPDQATNYDFAKTTAGEKTDNLMDTYNDALRNARNPNKTPLTNTQLYRLRAIHNELTRRGINMAMFNHDKEWANNPEEMRKQVEHELFENSRHLHIFHENAKDFHDRTAQFTLNPQEFQNSHQEQLIKKHRIRVPPGEVLTPEQENARGARARQVMREMINRNITIPRTVLDAATPPPPPAGAGAPPPAAAPAGAGAPAGLLGAVPGLRALSPADAAERQRREQDRLDAAVGRAAYDARGRAARAAGAAGAAGAPPGGFPPPPPAPPPPGGGGAPVGP
jgi:hypothetical protein